MNQLDLPSTRFVSLERWHGRSVVRLRGEIDIMAVTEIGPVIDSVTSRPAPRLVLVLDEVEFFDCSGIRLLCRARRRVVHQGGQLMLVGSRPSVHRLLALFGLLRHFPMVRSQKEAFTGPSPVPGRYPGAGAGSY